MAFTVEDGTGLSTSNAYLSVADFTTHHTDRNVTSVVDGAFETAEIQGALVQATDYIDKRFGRRFRGWRRSRAQALEWPRTDAFDDDDYLLPLVPEQLKKATAEYALIVLQLGRGLAPIPGTPFPIVETDGTVTSEASGALRRSRDKVGPIEEEREYMSALETNKPMTSTGNSIQNIPEYPQADLWIEELTVSRGSRRLLRG